MTETRDAPNGHTVRSERSTRLLIRAAGELIAEGGYATVTLAMVGERAGYSRSLATARFGSKAKLLDALVDHIVTRWNLATVIPKTEGEPGLEALTIVLRSIRDSYGKDPQSLRVLYALMFEALGPDEELRVRFRDFHRDMRADLAATVRRGIEDGSITAAVDPEAEARFIMATLRGVGYQWRLDPEEFEPVSPLDMLIESTRARLEAVPAPAER
ncbi:TetR/AcrR family transcriptional regulator [Pseudonocardia xishanensis]|uniref:TetR/AcrR family transcriptional regulator n=1 Tax=Pseudonocardia xishanensis TaxID=630995 RepID=A0ABP8RUD4_9PSEU